MLYDSILTKITVRMRLSRTPIRRTDKPSFNITAIVAGLRDVSGEHKHIFDVSYALLDICMFTTQERRCAKEASLLRWT